MMTNLSIRNIKSSPILAKTIMKTEIIVKSGITELDKLQGGFKTGEMIFLDGNSRLIAEMPNQLCVNTYRTFHSDTIYIDGGMCANPYEIAKYARVMEIDQRETLEHIQISRAFTVYQLSTLLQDKLEPIINKCKPRTLIIGMLPRLFLDPDVSTKESQILLKNILKKIRKLTQKYDLITVFTNLDSSYGFNLWNLRKLIHSNVDEVVRMKQLERCICIDLIKKQERTFIVDFSKEQLHLEEFGMVM
jgi:hypothetical protein